MNEPFRSFFSIVRKKVISFVLKIIVHFSSILFVFSVNDRLVKSIIQKNCLLIKIVRSVKKLSFFQKYVPKKSFVQLKTIILKNFVPKVRSDDFKSFV